MTIYTIGHSTREPAEFLRLLRKHEIEQVADIRTVPRSRHNPQFIRDTLAAFLGENGIRYIHLPGLGGLRRPKKPSPNTAWKNASFRGFADYMQTDEFAKSIDELLKIAGEGTTVIMCAEAVPWRCHRSLVGDALLARGIVVIDILSETSSRVHEFTPWAKVRGTEVIYPG